MLLAPDMTHDYEIKELLEITTELLLNATITDQKFHKDLIVCQKKVLKRFLKTDERKEIENMINFSAEKLGLKPNVTGFEEEMNLAYFDGERDGYDNGYNSGYDSGYDKAKLADAQKMIELGSDDEFIVEVTGLDLKTIHNLR